MNMYNILNIPQLPEVSISDNSIFVSDSYFGIELEVESNNSEYFRNTRTWNVVPENSIVGFEAVLAKPMAGNELYSALIDMEECFNSMGDLSTAFPERTSVHVHVNILDMTFHELINFIVLSIMLEKVLYKYVAPHRSKNHFCWSFGDCQDLIKRLITVYKEYNIDRSNSRLRELLGFYFRESETKYAGINLSSIKRYGSLEFRMHEGTHRSQDIIRWINILGSIKNYAKHPGRTPSNILETKIDEGIASIFTTILGPYEGVLGYEGIEDDILHGIRLAQDFVWEIDRDSVDYDSEIPYRDSTIFNSFVTNRFNNNNERRNRRPIFSIMDENIDNEE